MSELSDEVYLKDPRAKSVEGFIAGLNILTQYMKDKEKTFYFCGGEHDILYIWTEDAQPPEDSQDGLILAGLGFHQDEDCEGWVYYT